MRRAAFLVMLSLAVPAPSKTYGVALEADETEVDLRRQSCLRDLDAFRASPGNNALDGLLACLSHPDPHLRRGVLGALREALEKGRLTRKTRGRLAAAAEVSGKDPDIKVRRAAGALSRALVRP